MLNRPSLIAFALLVLAAPAAAEIKPSQPTEVAAATVDCWRAIGESGVDQGKLKASGWEAATFSKDGKPVDTPLRAFGKKNGNVVLMLVSGKTAPNCMVLAKVAQPGAVKEVADQVLAQLKAVEPKVGVGRKDGGIVFLGGPRIALLEASGTKEAPGTRIIVGYTSSEKK